MTPPRAAWSDARMGDVHVRIGIENLLTGSRLERIGIERTGSVTFMMADGRLTVLEQLGLAVDPVRRRLIPAPIRL
jgi:hypothetical protein